MPAFTVTKNALSSSIAKSNLRAYPADESSCLLSGVRATTLGIWRFAFLVLLTLI